MKIVFVTTEGFDIVNGNTHLNFALIQSMLNRGHKVHLVQSFRHGKAQSVPSEFEKNPLFTTEIIERNKVKKSNFFGRAVDEFKFYDAAAKAVNSVKDGDVVFFQASGLTFYLVEKIKKCKMPILLNVQDVFPDQLVTTGVCTNKLILKLLYFAQKRMYGWLAHVTVLSEDMKDNVIKKFGVPKDKVSVIYNWFDEDIIREKTLQENSFKQKYKLKKSRFVIQYAGNLGYVLDYNVFIELGKRLSPYPNFLFQIVGNGSCEHILKERVSQLELKNFEFLDFQPLETVSDVYSYCDVCLVPLKKGVIYHSVPSKASIVTACGRPVLLVCDANTSYGNLFVSHECGCVCDYDNLHVAVDYLLKIANNPSLYERDKNNSRNLAYQVLSKKSNCYKEIDILERLVQE